MQPVKRWAVAFGCVLAVVGLCGAVGTQLTAAREKDFLVLPFYISAPQLMTHIGSVDMPAPGVLKQLTFHVGSAGAGGTSTTYAVTHEVTDGGPQEVLCSITVDCSAPVASHIYPDGGACDGASIASGEIIDIEPTSAGCVFYPGGFLTPTIELE